MHNGHELRSEDEETDFFEVILLLWNKKCLVFIATLVVFSLTMIYVVNSVPVYEGKLFVQPPSQNDISALNIGRGQGTEFDLITVKEVYDAYLRNLQSEMLRRKFFREVYLPSLKVDQRKETQDDLYARFNAALTVTAASKDNSARYLITVRMSDPQQVADWLARFTQLAGILAKQDILQDIKGDAAVKANNIQRQVSIAKDIARRQREDQITRLEEALRVAKSIGLENPPVISGNLVGEISSGMEGALTYMRGSKALEAEINNLHERESDDPFIENLRKQQAALKFYRELTIDSSSVAVFRQDGGGDVPDKAISPKKALVMLSGLLGGGLLGVFLALIHHFWTEILPGRRSR